MFGYYPTFHTLTSVRLKSTFSMLKICFPFAILKCCSTKHLFNNYIFLFLGPNPLLFISVMAPVAPFTLYRYSFDPLYVCSGSSAFTLYRAETVSFTLPVYTLRIRFRSRIESVPFKPKFHEQFSMTSFSMTIFICSCRWSHMTIFHMTSVLVQKLACQLFDKCTCHMKNCHM